MNELKGIILVFFTAVISGVSVYVNSIAVKFGNPYVFTGLKNLLVGLILLGLILGVKEWRSIKKLTSGEWWRLGLVGLIGGAVPFLIFFKGLSLTTAAKGGFIHKTMFVYVGLLALLFLKEKLNRSMLLGLGALLVGNILFLGIRPSGLTLGDGLVFLAVLFWSAEIIVSKRLLARLPANIVAWGRMFFGGIFIFIYLITTRQLAPLLAYDPEQWKWIAVTTVFLLAYVWTFYHGLQQVRASVATAVLALGAPITNLITVIANDGLIWATPQIFGVVLIVAGILLLIGIRQSTTRALVREKYS